jgi:hypothetical protein
MGREYLLIHVYKLDRRESENENGFMTCRGMT